VGGGFRGRGAMKGNFGKSEESTKGVPGLTIFGEWQELSSKHNEKRQECKLREM